MILTANDKHRFLAYVFNRGPNDCWEWLGAISNGKYGHLQLNGKFIYAHRIAYFLKYGIDPGDLCVCHCCDNPSCCNPKHLFLGTNTDNMQDARQKGRNSYGEKHGRAKLTEKDVIEIKRLLRLGVMHRIIAKKFNVSRPLISYINNNERWSHV